MPDRYEECFLYVDADDPEAVLAALGRHLGAEAERRTLSVPGFQLDVVRGDRGGDRSDFVGWGTVVEVYADRAGATIVPFVTDLMVHLRSLGHRVVAACDFEDELPQTDFR